MNLRKFFTTLLDRRDEYRTTFQRRSLRPLDLEVLESRETPAAFAPGNLAIIQADSIANNTTATIIELRPGTADQTPVQMISILGSGTDAIRVNGSNTTTLYLSRSDDGTLLTFTGHNSTNTTSNAGLLNPRAAVVIDGSGNYTLATTYSGISGQQTRSATTLDNSNWWIADQAGVYSNDTNTPSPSGNFRGIKSFGGTVYVGQQSANSTNIQVATLSAPAGGTITGIPGLSNNTTFQDYYFIQSGNNGTTYDVLYVTSNTSATAGSIAKYSLVSGNWVANGSYTTTFGGFSLAAIDSGDGALLYVTTGNGATPANRVLKLMDSAGYNAAITINTSEIITLYTSPAGTTIKGIEFAPGVMGGTDTTPPEVQSITRLDGTPTNGGIIRYEVKFTESVMGIQTSSPFGNFIVTVTEGTFTESPTITNVAGNGDTYTVTLDTGSGDGSLRLDFLDDDSVVDESHNPLGGSGSQNYEEGPIYTVDRTPPQVESITRTGTTPSNLGIIEFEIRFSEAVAHLNESDINLVISAGISGTEISSINPVGPNNVYRVLVNTGVGDGTIQLNLNENGSVTDLAGNALYQPEEYVGPSYMIDKTAPIVERIELVGSTPTNSDSVEFLVVFNESVSGVSLNDFELTVTGLNHATLEAVRPNGASDREFLVRIVTGQGSGTLGITVKSSSSEIEDEAGNKLIEEYTAGPPYQIDRIAPFVEKIEFQGTTPTNSASAIYQVLFSEAVIGVDELDFEVITTGTLFGVGIASITPMDSTRVYTVTLNTGTGSGTIRLNLSSFVTIVDGANNSVTAGIEGEYVTIDRQTPEVQAISLIGQSPTNQGSVIYEVTFSEDVSGVGLSDFELSLFGVDGAVVSSVEPSMGMSSIYTVTVSTGSGDGTIRLDVKNEASIYDTSGNQVVTGKSGESVLIDKSTPAVAAISLNDEERTSEAIVQYTVLFNEIVNGVDASDFTITTSGAISSVNILSISPSGTSNTYTVTVSTGTGDGTIRLDVNNGATIYDVASNQLIIGAEGDTVVIDKTPPQLQSITTETESPTNASTVRFLVTFSEVVDGVNLDNFALTLTSGISGAVIASVDSAAGPSAVYFVTVLTGSGDGSIRLDLVNDGSIKDLVENGLGGSFNLGETYEFDRTIPGIISITRSNTSPSNSEIVEYFVQFSEPVSGVDASDFVLSLSGITGAPSIVSILPNNEPTSQYFISVNTGAGSGLIRLDLFDNDSIKDVAGNPLGGIGEGNADFTSGEVYTMDRHAPRVISIERASPATTNIPFVQYIVTFSEDVNGLDTSDFVLDVTNLADVAITSVVPLGSSTTFSVTISTGTGSGTIRLVLADDDTIVDSVGNPLGSGGIGNGDFSGQVFTIDRSRPTNIVRLNLTSSSQTILPGQLVRFQIDLIPTDSSNTPTGKVRLFANNQFLGDSNLIDGKGSLATTSLPVGILSIRAVYSGDTEFLSSSSTITQVVGDRASRYVAKVFTDLTGSTVPSHFLSSWSHRLRLNQVSRTQVALAVMQHPAYLTRVVFEAYQKYLRRPPSKGEMRQGVFKIQGGHLSIPRFHTSLLASSEYLRRRAGNNVQIYFQSVINDLTGDLSDRTLRVRLKTQILQIAQRWPDSRLLTSITLRGDIINSLWNSQSGREATIQHFFIRYLKIPVDLRLGIYSQMLQSGIGHTQILASLLGSTTYYDSL